MPLPTYDDIIALLKQGATDEAQEQFNALHEKALKRRLQDSPSNERLPASESDPGSKRQLESDGIAYYHTENGKKNGPFCRRCYDVDAKLVRLSALDGATYVCSACKTECARNLCG